MLLMYIGLFVLIVGAIRLFWPKRFKPRIGNDITLPLHSGSRPPSPTNSKSPRHSPTISTSLLSFLPKRFFNTSDPPVYYSPTSSPASWSQLLPNNADSNDYRRMSQNNSRSSSPSNLSHRPTTSQDGPLPLPLPPKTNNNTFWPFKLSIWRAWIFRNKSLQQHEQSTPFITSRSTSTEIKIADDERDFTRFSSTGSTEKTVFYYSTPSSSTSTSPATGFRSPLPPQYSSPRSFQSSSQQQQQQSQQQQQQSKLSPLPEYSSGKYQQQHQQRGGNFAQQQQHFNYRQLDFESSSGTTSSSETSDRVLTREGTGGEEYGLGLDYNSEDEKKK